MAKVNLPRTNQTGVNEWADVQANDEALKEGVNNIAAEQLGSESVTGAKLATGAVTAAKVSAEVRSRWYTPSVIEAESTRESTSFGKMGTPDEIAGVELATNGVIMVAFRAQVKASNETGNS